MRSGQASLRGWLVAALYAVSACPGGTIHVPTMQPHQPGERVQSGMGRVQLASGLRLLVRAAPLGQLAAVQAWVEAGSTHEPEGQAGLAHLCQHLIAAALASRAAALGAQASAWTTADHSVFQLLLPSRFLDEGIDLLATILTHPPSMRKH